MCNRSSKSLISGAKRNTNDVNCSVSTMALPASAVAEDARSRNVEDGGGCRSGTVPKVSALTEIGSQCIALSHNKHSTVGRHSPTDCDASPSLTCESVVASVNLKKRSRSVQPSIVRRSVDKRGKSLSIDEFLQPNLNRASSELNNRSVKNSQVSGCVFSKNLRRASLLLDQIDSTMEVFSSVSNSNLTSESADWESADLSPTPPTRPRTPIDERDPELVRAELRYETVFQRTSKGQTQTLRRLRRS